MKPRIIKLPRFEVVITSNSQPRETFNIVSQKTALAVAQSWYSRGLQAKVTDRKTGKVIYNH